MSSKLSHEQLQTLALFNKLPEARACIALIAQRLGDADAALRSARGEEVFRAQGRALALAELIDDIEQADQRLQQSKARQGQRPVVLDSRMA